jgi:hypothetical protein
VASEDAGLMAMEKMIHAITVIYNELMDSKNDRLILRDADMMRIVTAQIALCVSQVNTLRARHTARRRWIREARP